MLRLIPAPVFRLLLRGAHKVRHRWRALSGRTGTGVTVIGLDLDGSVLLIRHSYGPDGWYFPGGGIKRREAPEDAARREMREETGCRIENLERVGIIEEHLSGAPHTAHVFEGVVRDAPEPDGREVVEARFFPLHSLPEPLGPRTRARLDLWRARQI